MLLLNVLSGNSRSTTWDTNDHTLKKGNQGLYFKKRLKSLNVCPKLVELFCRSTVESVVTFNNLGHFGRFKEQDKARLSKVT